MVRKLFIVLVTLGMLSPMAAFALGFGNITLHSALGQKLDADIGILSPSPRDIRNLKIQMASYQAFSRAGIDKPPVLTSLKFAIKQRAGGQYYIHVSSPQPIRAPYLDFLLQLTWPTGRMLREYTMLLDPPSLFRKETHAIVQTPVVQPPVATARPAPAPVPRLVPAPVAAPVPAVAPVKPVPPVPVARPAQAKPPAVAQPPVSLLERVARRDAHRGLFPYIPIGGGSPAMVPAATGTVMVTHITRKGDKLWDIAQKMRPDEAVSIYQMMMALLKSNPQAFEQDNVNRLKTGYVLRIENPALLNAISKREAAHEFRIQTQDWEAYRQRVARAAGKQPLVTTHTMTGAPVLGKPVAESGKLELLVPEGKGESAGNGQASATSVDKIKSIEAARRQLSLAIEAAVTEKRKNAEVTGRLKQLESQIANMQRLIALKNDELATLQEQMRKQGKSNPHVVTPPTTAVTTSVTPLAEPAAKAPIVAPTESVAVPTAAPMTAQNTSAVSSAGETSAEQVTPSSTTVAPPRPVSIAPAKPWWQVALATASGLLAILLASPLLLAAAVAILLILILLLIVVRRRKKGYGFQESILTGEANVAEQGSATEGKNGDESSFLSDFAVSGVNAIQEDNEVDPLTEADVYVAYGRYQQAEELLGEALKQDPKRKDIKLKLLEVHYANKNRTGFEAMAEDLYAEIGDPDAPEWKKVVDMGAELAPGNPMFSGSASPSVTDAAGADASAATLSKDEVMDIGLNTGMFQNEDFQKKTDAQTPTAESGEDLGFDLDLGNAAAQTGPGADLDFNLDLGETPTPAAVEAKQPEVEKADEGADFNLDFTEPQVEQGAAATPTPAEKGTDDEFSLEFHSEEEPVSMVEPEESGLDFDLGGLDLDAPVAASETPAPGPASAAREDDTRIDMETPAALREDDTEVELNAGAGAKAPEAMDFDIEAGDAAGLDIPDDLDEVGTKLDLARAYIEMGDPDGARSILDEVVDEGSDGQKQEAQALISQIG